MKKRVLVIDDEAAIRKSFELALEDMACVVSTVPSGEQGIAQHRQEPFNLIYLDLKMPGINGVETLDRIRAFDADTPVYIITAFYEEFFEELKSLGAKGAAFELMRKPVDSEQIAMVTRSVLQGDGT